MTTPSLYLELAESLDDLAPAGEPGQTRITRKKETVDDDVEAVLLEVLAAT